MAEILGIVSGLLTISETGFKTSNVLYNIGKSIVKAKDQINDLARELSNISVAFQSLAEVLRISEGLLKPALVERTELILTDCERSFIEIEDVVDAVERQTIKTRDQVKWPLKKAKVRQLRSRLAAAKDTLTLMVNILNLSAGITFLLNQRKTHREPSEDLLAETQELFESSAKSVIQTQLSFEDAEKFDRRLREKDEEKASRSLKSSIPNKDPSQALTVRSPTAQFAADLPGFSQLSLIEKQSEKYSSDEDGDQKKETSITRHDDIRKWAPEIVRELCISWTTLDFSGNLDAAPQDMERRPADETRPDSFPEAASKGSSMNFNTTKKPVKSRGFSLNSLDGDEPPARISTYNGKTIRNAEEGLSADSLNKSPVNDGKGKKPEYLGNEERDTGHQARPTSKESKAGMDVNMAFETYFMKYSSEERQKLQSGREREMNREAMRRDWDEITRLLEIKKLEQLRSSLHPPLSSPTPPESLASESSTALATTASCLFDQGLGSRRQRSDRCRPEEIDDILELIPFAKRSGRKVYIYFAAYDLTCRGVTTEDIYIAAENELLMRNEQIDLFLRRDDYGSRIRRDESTLAAELNLDHGDTLAYIISADEPPNAPTSTYSRQNPRRREAYSAPRASPPPPLYAPWLPRHT